MRAAPVQHVVAGPHEPPGPDELLALADAILGGVYEGDLAVALYRVRAIILERERHATWVAELPEMQQ